MGLLMFPARAVVFAGLGLIALIVPRPVRALAATFECPPIDLAGRPLISSSVTTDLFCRYQTVPNDFFCKYFLDTGLLKQDHDVGQCPPVASQTSAPCSTPSATPTATPTNTPTATPTNTGIPQGGACSTPAECSTGFCVDGVCCNTACNPSFGRCDLPGQRGTCAGISPAPALAPRAIAVAAALLIGVAAFALRRRTVRN